MKAYHSRDGWKRSAAQGFSDVTGWEKSHQRASQQTHPLPCLWQARTWAGKPYLSHGAANGAPRYFPSALDAAGRRPRQPPCRCLRHRLWHCGRAHEYLDNMKSSAIFIEGPWKSDACVDHVGRIDNAEKRIAQRCNMLRGAWPHTNAETTGMWWIDSYTV